MVQVAVDADVLESPVLEVGLVIAKVVTGEGCVMVAASPPDFCASDGNFFLGQG